MNEPSVVKEGCYLICLMESVLHRDDDVLNNNGLLSVEQIDEMYQTCLHTGIINQDCYVNDSNAVLRCSSFLLNGIPRVVDPRYYVLGPGLYILKYYNSRTKFVHFCLGSHNGEKITGIYDPLGESVTKKEGKLVQVRPLPSKTF